MNIFNKYGIKEVADVIFYSITRIGDEEFYTPVLFFDTLKVSSLTKNLETVVARGGKANTKLLSWNFESDSKLRLEDALFSQLSLNVFMNGRAMMKMSNWTSAIAKLNIANKYGQKNYSIKAFPSPKLTEAEEGIIFRCSQKVGYDSFYRAEQHNEKTISHQSKYLYSSKTKDSIEDSYVAENRKRLLENYYKRSCPIPYPHDIGQYIDYNFNKYEGLQIIFDEDEFEYDDAVKFSQLQVGQVIRISRGVKLLFREKNKEQYKTIVYTIPQISTGEFQAQLEKRPNGIFCITAGIALGELVNEDGVADFLVKYSDFFPKNDIGEQGNWYRIGNEFFLTHVPYFVFPRYLEVALTDLCFCDQIDKSQRAIPKKVIDAIAEEIDSFKKIGYIENDLYESEVIDRFEKCIVNKRTGQKIDLYQQYLNLKKQYNNEKDTYTIFYDEKTMLPFTINKQYLDMLYTQKCLQVNYGDVITKDSILEPIQNYFKTFMGEEWANSLTCDDFVITHIEEYEDGNIRISPHVYYQITKHDYITLKFGTVYYKWTRTINEDISGESLIGIDLSIDADTFPGEYLIVGETYIRQQKTGKDQRYQFVINRASISASTKFQLQAAGDPSIFTVDVDLLAPKTDKKAMVELRQYNVDEDKAEGGFRIVPQTKKHSQTIPLKTYDEIIIENNEIY